MLESLLRSNQVLAGADALLPDVTDPVLHADDAVLPTSALDSLPVLAVPGSTTGGATDGAETPAILPQAAALDTTVNQVLGDATAGAGANPGLLGPVTNILPEAQGVTVAPAEAFANDVVLDLHNTLELAGDNSNLLFTTHGLTNLGETVGLGRIGGANLATDAIDTPQALLDGDTGTLTHIPTDLGNIAGAANTFVSYVETDLTGGGFLANPVGNLTNFGEALTTLPVTSIANDAVDTIHTTLELALDPFVPSTIHGITGLGNAVGLGEIGGTNALTDVLDAPGALLAGNTTPLTDLPGDVAVIGTAAGGVLGGIGADLGQSSLLGSITHPTSGGGLLGGDLPGTGVVGEVTSVATGALGAGDAAGLGGVTQAVTSALDGSQGGLVHDVTQVPGDLLGGASSGAAPLPGDAGGSLSGAGAIVGAAGGVAPEVASIVSGGAGDLAGTATGLAGSLTGSGAGGSHDLVTVSVGPQTPASGSSVDILSNGDGATHAVDSHVGTASAPVPTLGTVAILPDGISFPAATGGGSDALSGIVAPIGGAPGGSADAGAASTATVDLGIVHVDVPIVAAHADPLTSVAQTVHL